MLLLVVQCHCRQWPAPAEQHLEQERTQLELERAQMELERAHLELEQCRQRPVELVAVELLVVQRRHWLAEQHLELERTQLELERAQLELASELERAQLELEHGRKPWTW